MRPARAVPSVIPAVIPAVILAVILAAVPLTGCADARLPRLVLDDGPAPADPATLTDRNPQAVLTGERPVRRADPTVAGFPNLASVPARPTAFSTPAERQALFDRLQADRSEGARTAERAATPSAPREDEGQPRLPDAPPPAPQPIRR